MKSLIESKTFWLAVAQAIGGAVIIFLTEMPDLIGYVPIAKSIVDIVLRMATTDGIGSIT
jgi:hypothetical protein